MTTISWLFIALGAIALLVSLLPKSPEAAERIAQVKAARPLMNALFFVGPILAFTSGVFMLRGHNWARWLLVLYCGYSVLQNVIQSPLRFAVPGLLFALVGYYLFRPNASAFFRAAKTIPSAAAKA